MKKSLVIGVLGLCALISIFGQGCAVKESRPWLGVHVGMSNDKQAAALTEVVGPLAGLGINTIITEINYGFEYQSHPELRGANPCTKEQIGKLVAECKKHHVRLIPQFQCLGHQSWSRNTAVLLTKYPQFDETPGLYPENKGIYCRSWCPLHPEVNPIIFSLMDELIDSSKLKFGKWEGSENGTAGAINLIPKDIIMCDWHYELRPAYESVPMFLEKGFRVWPASWKKPDAARAFVEYSLTQKGNPRMLGHLNTTWGAVRVGDLPKFEPLLIATGSFKPQAATTVK